MKTMLLASAVALVLSTGAALAGTSMKGDIPTNAGPSTALQSVPQPHGSYGNFRQLAGDGSGADVQANHRQLAGDGSGADVQANRHMA
jgi:hypothetical protein